MIIYDVDFLTSYRLFAFVIVMLHTTYQPSSVQSFYHPIVNLCRSLRG
jgi:hypothetical protein